MKSYLKKYIRFLSFDCIGRYSFIIPLLILFGLILLQITSEHNLEYQKFYSYYHLAYLPFFFYFGIRQLMYFNKEKKELSIVEGFCFFLYFGLAFSSIFGLFDYSLYRTNSNNLSFDRAYLNESRIFQESDLTNRVMTINSIIDNLKLIDSELNPSRNLKLVNEENLWTISNNSEITIQYTYITPGGGPVSLPSQTFLTLDNKLFKYRFDLDYHPEVKYFGNEIEIKEVLLKNIINNEIRKFNDLKVIYVDRKGNYEISYLTFIYNRVLQSLNYDIGLFKPQSLSMKAVTLFYSVFRLIYFGFLIFFILERKTTGNNV
jgi:hypothetical protein